MTVTIRFTGFETCLIGFYIRQRTVSPRLSDSSDSNLFEVEAKMAITRVPIAAAFPKHGLFSPRKAWKKSSMPIQAPVTQRLTAWP